MSTKQTERYHLHLWEGTDAFLRTEFNEDNENTERALVGLAEGLDKLRQDVADMSYNVFQGLLQNYYEGKATEHKKGLVFDGFLDDGLTAERSPAILRMDRRLVLSRVAQPDMVDEYVTNNDALDIREYQVCRNYTATEFCFATGFVFRWRSNTANTSLTITLQPVVNGDMVGEPLSLPVVGGAANVQKEERAVFPEPVALKPGDSFWVRFTGPGNVYPICGQSSRSRIGGRVLLDSPTADRGGFASVERVLSDGFDRARLWVRHLGGRVSAQVNGQAMVPISQRSTVNLQGDVCMETEFQLEGRGEPRVSLTLGLDLGEDQRMEVYDYGAAFF